MDITHAFVSTKDDGADATRVRPSDWNAGHVTSGQFTATWDGGQSGGQRKVIEASTYVDVVAPHDGTITGWTLLADQPGSAVVDIWSDTYANFPPTVADTITAAAKPVIASGIKGDSTTLTGWTTAITAGDVLRFSLDSAATITRLLLVISYSRP